MPPKQSAAFSPVFRPITMYYGKKQVLTFVGPICLPCFLMFLCLSGRFDEKNEQNQGACTPTYRSKRNDRENERPKGRREAARLRLPIGWRTQGDGLRPFPVQVGTEIFMFVFRFCTIKSVFIAVIIITLWNVNIDPAARCPSATDRYSLEFAAVVPENESYGYGNEKGGAREGGRKTPQPQMMDEHLPFALSWANS